MSRRVANRRLDDYSLLEPLLAALRAEGMDLAGPLPAVAYPEKSSSDHLEELKAAIGSNKTVNISGFYPGYDMMYDYSLSLGE